MVFTIRVPKLLFHTSLHIVIHGFDFKVFIYILKLKFLEINAFLNTSSFENVCEFHEILTSNI